LAAYPTKALTEKQLSVLSVYGREDGGLNMEKLEEGKTLMPAGYADLRRDYADNRREERNEA